MQVDKENTIELILPSTLGNEKAAMDLVESVTKNLSFSEDRQEEIKTAVAEACINAFEHGNSFNHSENVLIVFKETNRFLEIDIEDSGGGFNLLKHPEKLDVKKKLSSKSKEDLRGWGLYIIKKIVDKLEAEQTNNGYMLKMFFKLPGEKVGK